MDACQLVEELKQEAGGNIWICGGAEVVRQLIEKNMNYNLLAELK